jgi:hypothetical protein
MDSAAAPRTGDDTMRDLRGRLEKLEQAARPQGGVVVIKQIGRETTDEMKRRWEREHPGESLDEAELVVILQSLEGLCPDGYSLENRAWGASGNA